MSFPYYGDIRLAAERAIRQGDNFWIESSSEACCDFTPKLETFLSDEGCKRFRARQSLLDQAVRNVTNHKDMEWFIEIFPLIRNFTGVQDSFGSMVTRIRSEFNRLSRGVE